MNSALVEHAESLNLATQVKGTNQLICLRDDDATEAGKDDCKKCNQPYVKCDTALEHKACQHKLHRGCMFEWLSEYNTYCLICGQDIVPKDDILGENDSQMMNQSSSIKAHQE